jgi:hypothetical protein
MPSESEVKEFRIKYHLLISLVVLTALLSFIGTIEVALSGSVGGAFMCRYAWGSISHFISLPIMSVLLILLAYPFKLLRGKMSLQTLTLLYMVGLTVSYYGIGHYETFAVWPVGFSRTLLYTPADYRPMVESWWWMPPYEVVQRITVGGAAVDWGAWAGSITFWTLYMLVFYLLGSSLTLLFRRRWIDIEMIPVPYVRLTLETIKVCTGELKARRVLTFFAIGFLIGFLYEFQVMMTYVFPWWPDLLAWRGTAVDTTSPKGCVCFYPQHILSQILVYPLQFNKDILGYAIFYLTPMDFLFSCWFFVLLIMVLAQIAYYSGYYSGIFDLGGVCRAAGYAGIQKSFTMGPPFYWAPTMAISGTIGLTIMILYNSRSYLVETIRLAVRGKKAPEEAKEPLTYRNIYLFIVISTILMLAFFFSAGLRIETTLVVLIITGFASIISATYIVGLIGAGFHEIGTEKGWPLLLVWPTHPGVDKTYTADWVMSHVFCNTGTNHATHGVFTGSFATLQTQAMGTLAKFNLKDVFILTSITTVVALIVANCTRVWIVNLLGIGRVPIWGGCAVNEWCFQQRIYGEWPPLETALSVGLVGFIIMMALNLLRARFAWWPLHPLGFIMAAAPSVLYMRAWNNFFGAWVAKYLTLRIGGSRAYEEYGIPVASGLMAGCVLSNLVAYIIGTIKFFIPF